MFAAQTKALETQPLDSPVSPGDSWKRIVEAIGPFLKDVSTFLGTQINEFEPEIAVMATYALTAQGKQLRSSLVALSADAAGTRNKDHVTVAAIIEMVHLATLVHDDVMDEAKVRRGQPTLTANWGNEISVLLGDCLFAHALKLAASFPTSEVCRAVATATNVVCSGEILQTQGRWKFDLTRKEYLRIVAMKTAELFALSCEQGAFLTHASDDVRMALRNYGLALGTAYQIYDDCLDLFGSEVFAGKSLGTDLAKGKITLPLLIILENGNDADKARLRSLVELWETASLPDLLRLLKKYESLARSKALIEDYLTQARDSLSAIPLSSGRVALHDLTEYLQRLTNALE